MKDFSILLTNPELAKYVRFEITGENLLELACILAKVIKPIESEEEYLTRQEVKALTGRSNNTTLWRWHDTGILKHNQIGMYKKSDVIRFMNKQ